ncbi:MAG: hypothetical protein PWQ07_1399, partial [Kosmotoga sp.]|nr:hypothetical protein [Kosmotoga sp.]
MTRAGMIPKSKSQLWAVLGLSLPALVIFFLFFVLPNIEIFFY